MRRIGVQMAQTYTITLGTKLGPTTVGVVATMPYARPRLQATIPADYDMAVTIGIIPCAGTSTVADVNPSWLVPRGRIASTTVTERWTGGGSTPPLVAGREHYRVRRVQDVVY